MRTRWLAPWLSLLGISVPAQEQREPVPTAARLAELRSAAVPVVVDALVDSKPARTVDALLGAATRQSDSGMHWLLLEQAHRIAAEHADVTRIVRIADATSLHFDVDATELLEARINELLRRGAAAPGELAAVWIERLEQAASGSTATSLVPLQQATRRAIARLEDPTLRDELDRHTRALDARIRLRESSPLLHMPQPNPNALDALSRAAACSKHAANADAGGDPHAATVWRHQALHDYALAWSQLDGLEQQRALRRMATLEQQLCATAKLGAVRAEAPGAAELFRFLSGDWRVTDGRIYAVDSDDHLDQALYRYAFRRIRSVTIHGGIAPATAAAAAQNFRLAIGPVTVILNWEVADQNHLWIGNNRSITAPRILQPGQEHEIVLRDVGGKIVVFVDGQPVIEGPIDGPLHGTVCVYPAFDSEVFVQSLQVEGDVDPRLPTSLSHPGR